MRRVMIITFVIVSMALVVWVLLNNRQRTQEMAKTDRLNAYPVTVVTVKPENITPTLSQIGEIFAEHDVTVIAEVQGKATAVMAETGSYITAGSPIVKVDDELPKAKFLATQANYRKAQKDLERFTALYSEEVISDSELENVRLAYQAAEAEYTAARRDYKNTTINAPISGLITMRPVNIGTMVSPGSIVANIVDVTQLKIRVNMVEQDVFQLKTGGPAIIETDVYPGTKFTGRITSISAKGDESHTFTVETMIVFQKEHPLKAGMFGRITFYQENLNAVLTIPREALTGSIKNPQVYIIEKKLARLHNIVTGREIGSNLVILEGLTEDQQVVVSGQDNLEDKTPVIIQE